MSRGSLRLVGIAGILQIALAYVPIALVPANPGVDAPAGEIVAFYLAHGQATSIVNWLGVLGLIPSFVVSAAVAILVRRAEGAADWLWLVVVVAYLVAYVALGTVFTVDAVLPFAAAGTSKEVVKGLFEVQAFALAFYFAGIAGAYAVIAWAALRSGAFPAWLGGLAALVAIVALVDTSSLMISSGPLAAGGALDLAGVGLEGLFVLALSVLLLARPAAISDPQAPAPAR